MPRHLGSYPLTLFQDLQDGLSFKSVIHYATYTFQTLEEAYQLAEYLSSHYPDASQRHMKMGLHEVFVNAIEHGNLGLTFEEKTVLQKENRWQHTINERLADPIYASKRATITIEITPSHVFAKIEDEGKGFDWKKYVPANNTPSRIANGRGLLLVQNFFDDLRFSRLGNVVECYLFLPQPTLDFPRFS